MPHLPSITDVTKIQLSLPGPRSGCYFFNPTWLTDFGAAASAFRVMPASARSIATILDITPDEAYLFLSPDAANACIERLRGKSIVFTPDGTPCTRASTTLPDTITFTNPLPRPILRMHSRIASLLTTWQQAQLFNKTIATEHPRLRSAGGTGNGDLYRSCPQLVFAYFTDEEFRNITLWRLGLAIRAQRTSCCKLTENQACGRSV